MAAVGFTDWAGAPSERRESCLRRGTQYIFSRRLRSEYLAPLHGNVAAATCEAAYLEFKGKLYPMPSANSGVVKQKTVGPITTVYDTSQPVQQSGVPQIIADLLYGMTYSSGSGPVYLERA